MGQFYDVSPDGSNVVENEPWSGHEINQVS